ncbi:class IV adenylate cyclase [Natronomonas sp. F2-12]|uniref:Class IV adenylate cyclase n=1 Tax=Natronomonas aquatica TaxID=2841590 RepID=A0A9R1CT17_9EURY|nr:class IV adenylate cyclase [Natronomonas aquatica]MCQ4333267.1 class IV adenylate cyclase [Natronomonas aquatica]
MYEVEMKVRADHDRVRSRLSGLGAVPEGTVRQVDTYYDHPVREFAETDEALRIRREAATEGEKTRVTYKGPLVEAESKTRTELETAIADGAVFDGILERLGFEPAATVEKTRERFRHGEYTVTLDTVSGLGEFLEVETEAEVIEPAREGAAELLQRLGFDPESQIRRSYLGLLIEADR